MTYGMKWAVIAATLLLVFIVTIAAVAHFWGKDDDPLYQQCLRAGNAPLDCAKSLGWNVTP